MSTQDSIKKAKEIIENVSYITLATVTPEGNPWNTPVYTAYDDKYTFFWASDKDNVHSQNIKQKAEVFAVMYDSTAPAGMGCGLYFQGKAYEIANPIEMLSAIKYLYDRAKETPVEIKEFMKLFPRRLYKFVPEKVWMNGDGDKNGNFVDIRTEVPLLDNK